MLVWAHECGVARVGAKRSKYNASETSLFSTHETNVQYPNGPAKLCPRIVCLPSA